VHSAHLDFAPPLVEGRFTAGGTKVHAAKIKFGQ